MSADSATMAITAMTTSIASGAGSAVVDEVRQLVRSVYSPMSLPSTGDASAAYRRGIVNGEHAEAGVLVGTVVTWVTYRTGSGELGPSALVSLARMLSDRARQAQNGTAPFARAEF
ncbi:hypothetical protein [Streptomyces achromogenes]|uniref:hypothetical protein n=1 Tax=Streptomyces achromogenes TaxID=67255 RepID=UPI00369C92EF